MCDVMSQGSSCATNRIVYNNPNYMYNTTTTLTMTNANVSYLLDQSALSWVVTVFVKGYLDNYTFSAMSNANTMFDFYAAFGSMTIIFYLNRFAKVLYYSNIMAGA